MRVRGWTVLVVGLAVLGGCKRREAPAGAASPAAQAAPARAPVATIPPPMPTPPPAAAGTVAEVRTIAAAPPAQVVAMLPGRKGTEQDCGSGEQASLQCVDLVVAGLPKGKSIPSVLAYAKKKGDRMFQGPCREAGDAVDCATVLGAKLGAPSVRFQGRKPRLEFTANSVVIRWRAMNLASEDMDVKLVAFF